MNTHILPDWNTQTAPVLADTEPPDILDMLQSGDERAMDAGAPCRPEDRGRQVWPFDLGDSVWPVARDAFEKHLAHRAAACGMKEPG